MEEHRSIGENHHWKKEGRWWPRYLLHGADHEDQARREKFKRTEGQVDEGKDPLRTMETVRNRASWTIPPWQIMHALFPSGLELQPVCRKETFHAVRVPGQRSASNGLQRNGIGMYINTMDVESKAALE